MKKVAFGKKEIKKDKRNTAKNKKELLKKKTFKKETGKKGLSEKETEVKKAEVKKAEAKKTEVKKTEAKKSAARPAVKKGLSGKPKADVRAAGPNILRKSKSPEKKTTGKTGPEKQKEFRKSTEKRFFEEKKPGKKKPEKKGSDKKNSAKKTSVKKSSEKNISEKNAFEKNTFEKNVFEKNAFEKKGFKETSTGKKGLDRKDAKKESTQNNHLTRPDREGMFPENEIREGEVRGRKKHEKTVSPGMLFSARKNAVNNLSGNLTERAKSGRGDLLNNLIETNKESEQTLKIVPLGGLEQIGMNITAFVYGDSIVVVDCGLAFPEDDMFGIDLVIPDTTFLEENLDKVKAFVITHGHEDHIGALPYVLKKINVPVYGTRLTMGIIENKLREHNLLNTTERHVVSFGDVITLGQFQVEFIKTNHSIVDAAALAITSPAGTIVHTGDFKVDYTPVYGDAIDLQRFAELGNDGVLALMCDSTNSNRPGHTPSEKAVGRNIDQIFRDHSDTRIIIATFASNVDRVQQIIDSAYKYGRKVVVEGRSMVNIIETATKLDVLKIPENTLIDTDQLKNYPGEKTVIITTGSQGESMAALSRMADGLHRKVTIGPNDTVIFSSSPIPGNEKAVTAVINKLLLKGADVISQDVHASGHPCQEDVKLIYHLVQPRYCIPVHGEYRHLKAQAKLLRGLGYDKQDIFILHSGDVLEFGKDGAVVREKVQVGNILVDGIGVGDVGNVVLRDRQHLAEDGIVIVAFALESGSCQLLSGPEITSRGFVYIKEADDMMTGAAAVAEESIYHCLETGVTDWNRFKSAVKDSLSDFFWKKTQRRPVILPMILEV